MSIVILFVDTFDEKVGSERRFDKSLAIFEVKLKLESITGIPSATQKLSLYRGKELVGDIVDDNAMLGAYPVDDYMTLRVKDTNPHRIKNQYTDVSLVEKYEMPTEEYEKRADTVRSFKERNKLGRFSADDAAKKETIELENIQAAEKMKIGDRCRVTLEGDEIGERLGTVKFIGQLESIPGIRIGVQYDEPLGKNDGSLKGERYFTCAKNHGGFVRPKFVEVGDFPEEDLWNSDDELDEM